MKTIVITAANGFIGQSLVNYFSKEHKVVALVRKSLPDKKNVRYVSWDGKNQGAWSEELEGAEAVINLAGKSVNCRYNDKNKAAIYSSRLNSTSAIGIAIANCTKKPKVWLNAASATIYAHSENKPNTEALGIIGSGFSVDVCQKWEACFETFKQAETRQIILRTAIVLGKDGGVMGPFKNLVRFGFGDKMGKGNQMFSWIHEEDVCRAIEFLIKTENTEGVYNISAPNPVTNEVFMKALRKQMMIPYGMSQPEWLLKFGAWLIGTETELILKSRFVIPERLMEAGFRFKFEKIEDCVNDLIDYEKTDTEKDLYKSEKSNIAGNICFFTACTLSTWFFLFGYIWVYGAALFIAYLPGLVALTLYFLGRKYDPNKKRYRYVRRILILGLIVSICALVALLLTN